jgi:arylsulfatase A
MGIIERFPTSRFLYLTLFLASLAVSTTAIASATRHPNIVLIMADDLGYGELGCYGQQWIKTPRLDELAREGMRFSDFYCGSPVCAPSRCVLMTGKHTGHAAIRNNHQVAKLYPELRKKYGWEEPGQQSLPKDEVTVAELIKAQGYATAAIGKWGLGMCGTTGDPNRHGFDLFYGYLCQAHAHNYYPRYLWRNDKKEFLPGNNDKATGETYSQDKLAEEALKFIREHKDGPFFLYLPFTVPHLSLQVPDDSLAEYKGKIPETPYKHNSKGYFKHPTPHAAYAAMITRMDGVVGSVVDELKELGLAENTLVLFTSDNGPTYNRLGGSDSEFFKSAGPLRGRKGSAYEGGIRVPLIAYWPGKITGGQKSAYVGAFCDVLPTLCDVAHAVIPNDIDGISFAPTLFGGKQTEHDYLYWEFPGYDEQQVVRSGKWKAIRSHVDVDDPPWELYDLTSDIGESRDVAAEHPDVVERLAKDAVEAHTPSKVFPLLASERPKNYEPQKRGKARKRTVAK